MPESPQPSPPHAGREVPFDSSESEGLLEAADAGPAPSGRGVESGDIDLYCLTCGYNLRGLTGDPRRCPECGGLNPVGDVILPAAIITEQLRRMETAPAFCLASFLAAAFFGAIFAMFLRPPIPVGGAIPCMVLLLSIVAMVWGVSVDRFRVSCMSKAGWPGALLRYHVWGLGLMLVVFGPAAAIGMLVALLAPPYQKMIALPVATVSATALAGVAAWLRPPLVARMYGRAREDLEVLQREVAVTLARDRTRKALYRQRR